MDNRLNLHSSERLLADVHPSAAYLVASLLRGVLDAVIVTVVVGLVVLAVVWFAGGIGVSVVWIIVLFFLSLIAVSSVRYRQWTHASLRVTSDRILIHHNESLFAHPLKTIKWSQYQESLFGRRTLLDVLFRVRPISIRFGNADAQLKVHFPSIAYAEDVKHYLDKVDHAIRTKHEAELKPFVAKPRGQRDAEGVYGSQSQAGSNA